MLSARVACARSFLREQILSVGAPLEGMVDCPLSDLIEDRLHHSFEIASTNQNLMTNLKSKTLNHSAWLHFGTSLTDNSCVMSDCIESAIVPILQ